MNCAGRWLPTLALADSESMLAQLRLIKLLHARTQSAYLKQLSKQFPTNTTPIVWKGEAHGACCHR